MEVPESITPNSLPRFVIELKAIPAADAASRVIRMLGNGLLPRSLYRLVIAGLDTHPGHQSQIGQAFVAMQHQSGVRVPDLAFSSPDSIGPGTDSPPIHSKREQESLHIQLLASRIPIRSTPYSSDLIIAIREIIEDLRALSRFGTPSGDATSMWGDDDPVLSILSDRYGAIYRFVSEHAKLPKILKQRGARIEGMFGKFRTLIDFLLEAAGGGSESECVQSVQGESDEWIAILKKFMDS